MLNFFMLYHRRNTDIERCTKKRPLGVSKGLVSIMAEDVFKGSFLPWSRLFFNPE